MFSENHRVLRFPALVEAAAVIWVRVDPLGLRAHKVVRRDCGDPNKQDEQGAQHFCEAKTPTTPQMDRYNEMTELLIRRIIV